MTGWVRVFDRLKEHCPPTQGPVKIDSADKCILYLYIIKGWSIGRIAKEVEGICSFHTIRNRLVKLNIDRRPRGGVRTKVKVTLQEDDLDLSGKELAVKYRISVSHAHFLKREKVKQHQSASPEPEE